MQPQAAPTESGEQESDLYSGHERETSQVQDRKRGQGISTNLELFDQSVRPENTVQARQQDADKFTVLYRPVQTDTFRVGVERVTNADAMAQGIMPLRKRGALLTAGLSRL